MKYLKTIGSILLIILGVVFLFVILGYSTSNTGNTKSLVAKITKTVPWHNEKEKISHHKVAVSTSNPYATRVGMDILNDGGNAVDAAVGVSYALSITEPYASGLGGGGGMLIYNPKNNQYHGIDYRDSAPVSHQTNTSEIGVPLLLKVWIMLVDSTGQKQCLKIYNRP